MPLAYRWDPAILVMLVAAPVVMWLTLAAFRQRRDRVARALVWFCLGILIWIVGFGFEVASADPVTVWFWLRVQFIGIMSVGPLWLLVLLRYVDADHRLGRWLWLLLLAPPLACYLVLLTNGWHWLFYQSVAVGHYARGPFFWVNAAVAYAAFAAAFAVVAVAARRAPRAQRQRLWLLAAASAVPLLPNIAFVLLGLPSRLDPTPLLFAVSGAFMVDLVTRGRLLAARPVALRTALATASDAIVVADPDGRIIEANPAARVLMGEPPLERLEALLTAVGASAIERDLLTHQAPQVCLLRGSGRIVEAQTMPVLEERRHQGLVAWLRDVTERERLISQLHAARADLEARVQQRTLDLEDARVRADERAAELAATVEAIPDGIVLLTSDGRPRLANHAATGMLGGPVQRERPLLDQLLAIAGGEGVPDQTALQHLLTSERVEPVELSIGTADGARTLQLSTAPVRDGGGQAIGHVVVMHDITPQRAWERSRQAFLAMAAHELRSPATGILLATQVLQRRLARLPEPDHTTASELLVTLQRQTRRLNALVNDLIDSARLEGGFLVVDIGTFDLAALARRIVAETATSADNLTVSAPNAPVVVLADAARVEQIIGNLLDNARKYSPAGSPVRVVVTVDDTAARLSVSDDGIGIPAEDLPRLFESFYRASNVAARSGLGLGLALSRELARRMGGDLTVDSAVGRGTTATLRLPRG